MDSGKGKIAENANGAGGKKRWRGGWQSRKEKKSNRKKRRKQPRSEHRARWLMP